MRNYLGLNCLSLNYVPKYGDYLMDSKAKLNNIIELSNGTSMPAIGFGCAFGNWSGSESPSYFQPELAWSALPKALEVGYKHFDTALVYGTHKILGQALGEAFSREQITRDEVFICSKIFHPKAPLALNTIGHSWDMMDQSIDAKSRVQYDFERCLDELNLGYLDLLLMHWPGTWENQDQDHARKMRETVWAGFEAIYETGKVKAIGVSNFLNQHFKDLEGAKIAPMVNQIEVNPYLQQREICKYCEENDIVVEAWAPFGSGTTGVLKDPVIEKLAEKYNKNGGQIILRWLFQKGCAALPKSSNKHRMQSNLEIFGFDLYEEDCKMIDSLDRGISSVTTAEQIL